MQIKISPVSRLAAGWQRPLNLPPFGVGGIKLITPIARDGKSENGFAGFLTLALRREDQDTLFFTRRLVMTGNTELGLAVKNAFDAL